MANQIQRETAQILQFHPRQRINQDKIAFENKKVIDLNIRTQATAVCWDSWYHETAVQSTEHPRKN